MATRGKTGLFFGSFNPIHIGHLIIANFMVTQTDLREVWMVVSPQNPLKERRTLAPDYDRLHLVRMSVEGNDNLRAVDIEFNLPKPSYTVDTLAHLSEKYPGRDFVLLMGGDNLQSLHKWKNYEILLRDYSIKVYSRPGYEHGPLAQHPSVELVDAPNLHISASYIRKCIREGKSIRYLVPDKVWYYLQESKMYGEFAR